MSVIVSVSAPEAQRHEGACARPSRQDAVRRAGRGHGKEARGGQSRIKGVQYDGSACVLVLLDQWDNHGRDVRVKGLRALVALGRHPLKVLPRHLEQLWGGNRVRQSSGQEVIVIVGVCQLENENRTYARVRQVDEKG
jgi:hypothetical protein